MHLALTSCRCVCWALVEVDVPDTYVVSHMTSHSSVHSGLRASTVGGSREVVVRKTAGECIEQ